MKHFHLIEIYRRPSSFVCDDIYFEDTGDLSEPFLKHLWES